MPLMTKIRESMSTVFAVFAGVFVVYIVLDWGMDITGRKQASRTAEAQEIGNINGHAILYKDFAEIVRQAAENQKKQTGTEPNEEEMKAIRDQIWSQVVEEKLYGDVIRHLGITITDQEIIDLVRGENPPEFLRQQFTDSLGNFDRARYEAALLDPRNKEVIIRVEEALRNQREREKMQSLLLSSVRVSEGEIVRRFADQNIKYDAEYILFDPNTMVKDEEISFTDEDLRRFYNEHSDEYKVDASRRLKYVIFEERPSKSDTDAVLNELQDIQRRANAGADFLDLANTYTETPVTDAYFRRGELAAATSDAVFGAKTGEIVGPISEANGHHLIKVLEFRSGKEEVVRARHILIRIENNDSAAALKQAREVYAAARRGESFEELARKHSRDASNAQNGGDLGWFQKGRMVKEFEEATFRTKPGQITGPVKTAFGYHIIKVEGKDNREVKFIDIHMPVRLSSQTRNDIYQRAQDFVYLAKEGDFTREATQSNLTIQETERFQKDAPIPQLGINPTVQKFAFNEKVGVVSEVISISKGYAVFTVSEIVEAGVRPLEEIKTAIEGRVKLQKKMEKVKAIATELRTSLGPNEPLSKITSARPDLTIQKLNAVTLGGFIPGIGRDLGFTGGIAALKPGITSTPIEGQRGIYIVTLLNTTAFDSVTFNASHDALRNQILNEKRNRFFTEWSENMKKSAEIVDNRDLFYR